jgi:hypothetical protein
MKRQLPAAALKPAGLRIYMASFGSIKANVDMAKLRFEPNLPSRVHLVFDFESHRDELER